MAESGRSPNTAIRPHPNTDGDAVPQISRRALLRSAAGVGVGAVAGGLSLRTTPWAAARGARIDQAELPTAFAQAAKRLLTPGAVMVLRGPGTDIAAAYGTGVVHRCAPLSLTDRFRIGSVTKTFTGTVILQLRPAR